MSSTLTLLTDGNFSFINSGKGTSTDQIQITKKAKEAEAHRWKLLTLSYNVTPYLVNSSNISEFENRVEQVRELLLQRAPIFSDADIDLLKKIIDLFEISQVLVVARLLGPLLESDHYSLKATIMLRKLLKHPSPEVRYVALEAISFALGEVRIAETILEEAKDILKAETSSFVLDYLESL